MKNKLKRDAYGRFKKSNYTFYKWISITSLIAISGILLGTKLSYFLLEKRYEDCVKKYNGANFIDCNNNEYFRYVADEPKIEITSVLPVKDDTNCVYNIKDSKNGNFKVNCNYIKEIVKEFGRDTTLIAIIFQESGFNPLAKNINTNGTTDFGIFQLNSKYWTIKQGDINHSISQAKLCKKQNGYYCWVAYSSGAYKNYLDEAELLLTKI